MVASEYINKEKDFSDEKAVLEGARAILMELFAENADMLQSIREHYWSHSRIFSNVVQSKEGDAAKYKDYFDFNESITTIPSHRILALFRGRQASLLQIKVGFSDDQDAQYCIDKIYEADLQSRLKIIG